MNKITLFYIVSEPIIFCRPCGFKLGDTEEEAAFIQWDHVKISGSSISARDIRVLVNRYM
jgi:hypothetical protein